MGSWRDSATQQAQDDMDNLLNATLPFAKDQLAKRGDFLPFGAVVTGTGEITLLAAYENRPGTTSRDLLAMLVEGARKQAAANRAAAIVADALIDRQWGLPTGKRDAIRVDLEHRDGHAIAIALPYTKRRFSKGIDYGELIAADGVRQIWT